MVDKTSSPNKEDESKLYTNLLSSVGLDWMFCDREPDQPQETRTLRSRSVSQVLHQGCGSLGSDQREQTLLSRDSSHGSGDQSSLGQTGMCSPSRRRRGHWFSSSSCRQTSSKQPKDPGRLVQRPKLVYLGQNHFLFLL